MAKHLKSVVDNIDSFLVSPAKRARKTAKYFHKHYPSASWKIERSIYETSSISLEDVIHSISDHVEVAVMFGHNPGFTYLANKYARTPFDNLPTCGIVIINFKGGKWQDFHPGLAEMTDMYYPKQFTV